MARLVEDFCPRFFHFILLYQFSQIHIPCTGIGYDGECGEWKAQRRARQMLLRAAVFLICSLLGEEVVRADLEGMLLLSRAWSQPARAFCRLKILQIISRTCGFQFKEQKFYLILFLEYLVWSTTISSLNFFPRTFSF